MVRLNKTNKAMIPNMKLGFTIVEFIVVIAIIGILATLTTMGFTRVKARARDTQRKADTRDLTIGLANFQDSKTYFPSVDDEYTKEDGTIDYLTVSSSARDVVGALVSGKTISGYISVTDPPKPLFYWSSNNVDDAMPEELSADLIMEVATPAQTAGFCQGLESSDKQFCLSAKASS